MGEGRMHEPVKPVALIIMDGWGIREMTEANAVALGNTPNYDTWERTRERCVLDASGLAVGLPEGQMGNSEVGHLNLGAGRIVYQDFTRINMAIEDGSLARNDVVATALEGVKARGTKLHLIGLFSDGGVHSHINHLFALIDICHEENVGAVRVHALLDGRDVPSTSALEYVES
ncbi:MAG: 2,3-bisphosphoglycerate-independent phosphoglycerate mutase, partial [Caldilineaceae bacterium]|nr:2,3-bisphosphoglycerate-independent phosphoglycerate mutase [Caldilineaceae bacterium]